MRSVDRDKTKLVNVEKLQLHIETFIEHGASVVGWDKTRIRTDGWRTDGRLYPRFIQKVISYKGKVF
jgi:hypothetical protein